MQKQNEKETQLNMQQQIPEVYSNTALVNFSPYEFEITLGLGSSNYEGVKPAVNVRMSPQFAKEFYKVLQENVDLYQEHVAKIVVNG